MISGQNCTPHLAAQEFLTTRQIHHKDSPVWFYHYVQSFSPNEKISGALAHELACEFAEQAWPDSEILIATHTDADHIHTHFIVNTVCYRTGKMLRQGPNTLKRLRSLSDKFCSKHGFSVLPKPQTKRANGMNSREYRSAVKGESWKFRLMNTIDQCMRYAFTREEFIALMESEGYQVHWVESRKSIFPVIIERGVWEKVQQKLTAQARPANGNKAKHRYAGLILCKECGSPFVPMIRYWNGKQRVEYVCKGYHWNGKGYCSSHRIHEETLDAAVQEFVQATRGRMAEAQKELKQKQKMWALRKPVLDAHIFALQQRIQELEREIDKIILSFIK